MTAFERELMQRLNHAGVNVKGSVSADQLRRIDKKLRNAEAAAGRTPHLSMSLDIRSFIAIVAVCCMGFRPGAEDRNASLANKQWCSFVQRQEARGGQGKAFSFFLFEPKELWNTAQGFA